MSFSAKKKSGAAMMVVGAIAILFLLPATAGAATGRSVAVTASATIKVPNDTATLGFGVKRERKTRGAALSATAAALRKVIATAQAFPGVGEGDIHTGRIDVSPIQKGKVTVYRATEGASVTLHEPSKAGELVSAVIAAGATGINGPTFGVGNQEAAFGKALAAAFDKAKERAAILATQAGAQLGPALTIEEGEGAQIVEPVEKAASTAPTPVATPPTKPGTSTVKATVHVVFELT
jgi:uncharacterized protein YggE